MGTMQDDANDIGQRMRALHRACSTSGDAALAQMAMELHGKLAQAFVDHLEPLGLDWGQVSVDQNPIPTRSGAQPNAGVKTKPTATAV